MSLIKPQLQEIILRDSDSWLLFTNPRQVIQVHQLDRVLPALHEIEDMVNDNKLYAAGFISYEAAPAFDPAHQAHSGIGFPFLWFGLYPEPRIVTLPEPVAPKPVLTWSPTIERATYDSAIEEIKHHISEGRTYQVNYTMRLWSAFDADPWDFFLHLAQGQHHHAAFVDTGQYVIASASPELFFKLAGETILSRPMKGTARRGRTNAEDKTQAQWLKDSVKNRAENVMIVDMIRNDLGRIAKIGSVRVPELFTLEHYPTLWQMTSTVEAETNTSLVKIFSALFPCASITGAPKVSTMRIISELETTPRRIYTGSIGYIAPNRNAKFNVAIRTVLIDRETRTAEFGIGGGIVWDSKSGDEYEEALLKARVLIDSPVMFSLFETMLWTPEEGFFLRVKHVSRLLDSAEYFGFPASKENLELTLNRLEAKFTSPQRVRLVLDRRGKVEVEHTPQPIQPTRVIRVCLATEPVNSNDIFLFHKTTYRDVYEGAKRDFPAMDDVLLFNENNELTEFTIGNLVVEIDSESFTPPISCGLLPGTFRTYLVETGQAQEKVIRLEDLKRCSKIYLVNSVRKWREVKLIGQ